MEGAKAHKSQHDGRKAQGAVPVAVEREQHRDRKGQAKHQIQQGRDQHTPGAGHGAAPVKGHPVTEERQLFGIPLPHFCRRTIGAKQDPQGGQGLKEKPQSHTAKQGDGEQQELLRGVDLHQRPRRRRPAGVLSL